MARKPPQERRGVGGRKFNCSGSPPPGLVCDHSTGQWTWPTTAADYFEERPQTAAQPDPRGAGTSDEAYYQQTAGTAGERPAYYGPSPGRVRTPKQQCEDGGTHVYRPERGGCITKAENGCLAAGREWSNGRCLPKAEEPAAEPVSQRGGGVTGGGGTETAVMPPATAVAADTGPGTTVPTAAEQRTEAQQFFADALPTFADFGGEYAATMATPDPYQRLSMADVLSDPRYVQAQREQAEAMQQAAAAGGVRGAGLITGLARGQQNLLTGLHSELEAANRAAYGLDLQRAGVAQQGIRSDFERAYSPARTALAYGLDARGQRHGQWLGEEGLGLQRQRQAHDIWWGPESQRRQFEHARGMQSAAHGAAAANRGWNLFERLVSTPAYQTQPFPGMAG